MSLWYNIDFELGAAAFIIVLYVFLLLKYTAKTPINRAFRKLVLLVLVADVMDIVSAATISYGHNIPIWFNMLLSTLYFLAVAMMGFAYMDYVACYIYTPEKKKKATMPQFIILVLYLGIVFVNLFTGCLFSFNERGDYLHGPWYAVVYAIPLVFLLYSSALLAYYCRYHLFEKKQMISMVVFILLSLLGSLIQFFWLPDVLLGVYTVAVAILIMMFSLETPDYQRLMNTMEMLAETKEEAEQARQSAQEANQAKTEFLANMSHELRTPINVILGYDEMILRETGESHTVEYAANVQAAGRTLLSIVNDILDFTNMDGGNIKLEMAPYSVLSLLQDVITYAEYNAEKKNLEFRVSIDDKIPQMLSGDTVRLMQIVNNLISNGIKYTQEGYVEMGVDWKKVDDKKGILSVRVEDSGIGMKEEDLEKISEHFLRLDKKKNSHIQGIGLGLSIVTRLLSLMGSRLEVQSEYGRGSVFSFQLEQEIIEKEPIGTVDYTKDCNLLWQSDSEKKIIAPDAQILAVDDNAMNLDLLCGMLKESKIKIDTASNGAEAINHLKSQNYHLVLMDHMMPVMDGIETLREIRKQGLCQNVPMIALTANAVSGAKEEYLSEGFDDYLSKPLVYRQLKEVLLRYLPEKLILEEETEEQETTEGITTPKGFLEKLSFLDTRTGMTYCCDSEEFYQEMLSSYLNSTREKELKELYEKQDWDNYRIQVHALKSTSLSIGALEVSEKAKSLEMAAKEGDVSYIQENHCDLLTTYQKLLGDIGRVLEGKEESSQSEELQAKDADILVVDDDVMNLHIAEKMLEEKFSVKTLKSGKEALQYLEQESPDLILLDLHMPEMDGFEVIRKLKANERTKEIPVIFLTADNDREVEVKGFQEGALDFITKPFIASIMIQRVNRMLELDRLQKNLQREVEKQTRKAESRRKQVERLSMQVMKTLAGAIDAKDKYTSGHSTRVAEYSRMIAQKLGQSEKEQEDIYYMGLLHDVGKIGVPDEIINKTSRLTDEEYEVIKTHPSIGAEILKNISEIKGIEIGARWHHERYDGKGYPDGLKGEEIPLLARIIGVADAYDAMTSKRSYRDVLPQEVVRAEIEKCKGTQFDPQFADIMLELIDEDTEYRMREI